MLRKCGHDGHDGHLMRRAEHPAGKLIMLDLITLEFITQIRLDITRLDHNRVWDACMAWLELTSLPHRASKVHTFRYK